MLQPDVTESTQSACFTDTSFGGVSKKILELFLLWYGMPGLPFCPLLLISISCNLAKGGSLRAVKVKTAYGTYVRHVTCLARVLAD